GLFSAGDEAIAIHGDEVLAAEIAEGAGFIAAGGDPCGGDVLENGLEGVEQIEVFGAGGVFIAANQHFFSSAARGDQTDAGFDQSDIGFGGRVDASGVEANLAAAAERQSLRRRNNRAPRIFDGHIDALKLFYGEMDIVPFAFLGADEKEHKVRTNGKIRRL